MVKKIENRQPLQSAMLAISLVLVGIAEMSTSTSTHFWWHEPDCPEELLD